MASRPARPRRTWTGSVEVRDAGPHEVWLTVRHPRFHAMNAPAARFRVRDPAREAAIRACARCRGTWGPQGILGRESCVCRTRDAGQRCFTAEDCASACVFHRFVVTRRAAGGQPARGITEGRCAPVTPLWSCWDVVHAGLSRSRPTPSPRYSRQCAD